MTNPHITSAIDWLTSTARVRVDKLPGHGYALCLSWPGMPTGEEFKGWFPDSSTAEQAAKSIVVGMAWGIRLALEATEEEYKHAPQ